MKTSTLKSLLVSFALIFSMTQVIAQDLVGMRIDVIGSRYSDQMYLFSVPTCTRYFDNGWDGYKMISTNSLVPTIYGDEPGGKFQVDAIPDYNETYIAFRAGEDSKYTLSFYSENLTVYYKHIYLVDLVENNIVDLMQSGVTYTFNVQPTDVAVQRFKIVAEFAVAEVAVVEPEVTEAPITTSEPVDSVVVETPAIDTKLTDPVVVIDTKLTEPVVVIDTKLTEPVIVENTVDSVVVEAPVIDTKLTEPVIVEDPVIVSDCNENSKDKKGDKDDNKKNNKGDKENLRVTSSSYMIVIHNKTNDKGVLNLINAKNGKLVKSFTFNKDNVTKIEPNVKAGVYVLNVSTKKEKVSTTVVFK